VASGGKTISWRHCLIGLVVGEVVLLVISNVALGLADLALGSGPNGGIVGVSSLLSIMLGSFVAARLAGHHGVFQGIVVGIGFIIVGAVYQFIQEAGIVHSALASGSHTLVDLGPMSMGNLISGDFLALFGGTIGGMFARRP
jgi:hypothetical protein